MIGYTNTTRLISAYHRLIRNPLYLKLERYLKLRLQRKAFSNPYVPILSLDFDGCLHAYTSGWRGASVIADAPTEGAMEFLLAAVSHYRVHIFSSRSKHPIGRLAMQKWLHDHLSKIPGVNAEKILAQITFPWFKPAAFLTIDDRAHCFDGKWPDPIPLRNFQTWQQKEKARA